MAYLKTFLVACAGGWLFSVVHMPLPWTLGPLTAVAAWQVWFNRLAAWPSRLRNIGMAVLGYVLGSPFTPQTGGFILANLSAMLFFTLLTIVLSLTGGYLISRLTGMGLPSGLLGSMPGGLSQMTLLSREIKGADAAEVTLMQTVRMVTVVFVVPFIVLHGLADQVGAAVRPEAIITSGQIPALAAFAGTIFVLLYLTKHINLPGRYVTAPVVGTAVLAASGLEAPALPFSVVVLAQVFVGISMGMDINVASLANWRRIFAYNCTSVLCVIGLLAVADYLFAEAANIPFATVFISTAPGGIAEMGLTAMMINADLSTVIAFQLFRLLFVITVGIPVLKWWLERNK